MAEESKEEKEKRSLSEKWAIWITISGGVIFIIALIWYLASTYFKWGNKLDPTLAAQAGDFIGGIVGSLWALAGVMLFYSALQDQRNDFKTNRKILSAQLKEFKLQQLELKETREVFKEQSETQKIQRFESSFYQLLNHYLEIVNTLKVISSNEVQNREGFTLLNEKFTELLSAITIHDESLKIGSNSSRRRFIDVEPQSENEATEWVLNSVNEFFRLNKDLLHFISLFYSLVNYVGKTANAADKVFFMNVLLQTNSEKTNMIIAFHLFTFEKNYDTTKGYLLKFGSSLVDQMAIIQIEAIREVITKFYNKDTYFSE
jgi:hypothetical protein